MNDSLVAQAGLLVELMTAALEPELEAAGITLATFDLLSAVHGAGGNATQADVARRLGVTPPTLSESVKAAVQRGLLEQAPDASDGRLKRLRLTGKGARVLSRILDGVSRTEETMRQGLDPQEISAAREVLRRATRNLARSLQGR
jgi:DNA-binding MarR family transcriptional regulator